MSKAPASSLDWSERHPASVIDLLHSHGWGWLASYLYMLRWDMGCFILLQDTPPGYPPTSVNIYPGGVSVNSAARLLLWPPRSSRWRACSRALWLQVARLLPPPHERETVFLCIVSFSYCVPAPPRDKILSLVWAPQISGVRRLQQPFI